jgi:hypothetical protein
MKFKKILCIFIFIDPFKFYFFAWFFEASLAFSESFQINVKKFTTRITLSANHSDKPDGVEIYWYKWGTNLWELYFVTYKSMSYFYIFLRMYIDLMPKKNIFKIFFIFKFILASNIIFIFAPAFRDVILEHLAR